MPSVLPPPRGLVAYFQVDYKTLKMMSEEDELSDIGLPLGECGVYVLAVYNSRAYVIRNSGSDILIRVILVVVRYKNGRERVNAAGCRGAPLYIP